LVIYGIYIKILTGITIAFKQELIPVNKEGKDSLKNNCYEIKI